MTAVRGVQLARAAASFSWSGLAARSSFSNLQALATASALNYSPSRFKQFGIALRVRGITSTSNSGIGTDGVVGTLDNGSFTRRRNNDVQDRLLDRLDPAHQLERLSRFFWHRDRLATLRGHWMYFYTGFSSGGHGLAGVNINTGLTEREVQLSDLDERFVTDEALGLMFVASGNRLLAYSVTAP
jgi:hypothetical protein